MEFMTDAVVVGDAHTSLVKRVQDCLREDKLGLIAPERSIVLHVESESYSNAWQQIESVPVAEIARSNFRIQVPAVEWSQWKTIAADLQRHITNGRDGIPTQLQVLQPGVIRVAYGNVLTTVRGQFKQAWAFFCGLDHQG